MQTNDCFWKRLAVFVIFLLAIVLKTIPAAAETKYSFLFEYNDGSGDFYVGYVYGPDGIVQPFDTISNQPSNMGGAALAGGYYTITGATSGYDNSYDAQEYITSYYDADTAKTSYTIYSSSAQSTADQSLYVSDRRYTAESGFVYDPSVPDTDAYFGDFDVTYYFSTYGNYANFLAYYITDLPYWTQPSDYPGCCSEVAGAIVLSYWDQYDYTNLLTNYDANWQSDWPDNTSSSPSSYVSLIGALCDYMGWTSGGTFVDNIGPGLGEFSADQGGYGFLLTTDYDLDSDRSSAWKVYASAISNSQPEILSIEYLDGDHSVVGRGYWNDGQVCVNMGWGTGSSNMKLDWNQTSAKSNAPYIFYMTDISYFLWDF